MYAEARGAHLWKRGGKERWMKNHNDFWGSGIERHLESLPLIGGILRSERRAIADAQWWDAYDKRYGVKSGINARARDMYGGGIGQGYTFFFSRLPQLDNYGEEWW